MTHPDLTRRTFLAATAAAGAAPALALNPAVRAQTPKAVGRKTIALIGTVMRTMSHSQHFIDRFLLGYSYEGGWHKPDVDLVALYLDQFPNDDLARAAAKRHNVPLYPSVAEALTRGTSKLAVDGVVIIGEHGRYPRNEKGQTLYPRYKWFKEVVKVFESSGRSVPVFNDKHLSTDWKECAEMVADSKRLGFPFLAGSSLPVTWRLPSVDVPHGAALTESVAVGYGGVDSYDFHGLETAQCMSERRKGGEVGLKSVEALRGDKVWERLESDGRETTRKLLASALSRCQSLPVVSGYPTDPVSYDWARQAFKNPLAYFLEHRDGFRTTLFILPPVQDFAYAGLDGDTGKVYSCMMYLPMPGRAATTAEFFNPLIRHIERMVVENRAPYPVERTLLTSGMTLAAVDSLHQGGKKVETPEMGVRYEGPKASLYWQA